MRIASSFECRFVLFGQFKLFCRKQSTGPLLYSTVYKPLLPSESCDIDYKSLNDPCVCLHRELVIYRYGVGITEPFLCWMHLLSVKIFGLHVLWACCRTGISIVQHVWSKRKLTSCERFDSPFDKNHYGNQRKLFCRCRVFKLVRYPWAEMQVGIVQLMSRMLSQKHSRCSTLIIQYKYAVHSYRSYIWHFMFHAMR